MIIAKEWQYASFIKYVKQGLYEENWCDFTDDKHLACSVHYNARKINRNLIRQFCIIKITPIFIIKTLINKFVK